jgi:putative ABC transport system substrate-binding protein
MRLKRREFVAGGLWGVGAAMAALVSRGGTARAQKSQRLGFFTLAGSEAKTWMPVILAELTELGFHEGRNLNVDIQAVEPGDDPAKMAGKLIAKQPDVLIAGFGTLAAKTLKEETSTVPIVFVTSGDPVGAGLVASLARPGGNVTGLTDQAADVGGKRLSLLQDATAGKTSFAVLGNPDTPFFKLAMAEIERAAAERKMTLKVVQARSADEVDKGMASLHGSGVAGLLVLGDPVTIAAQLHIIEQATAAKLPTMFQFREAVQQGGLMSYGANRKESYKQTADYVGRILRGAKPADLPVKQPTKFEFLLNYTTAKAIGLAIPAVFLATADDVIH